MMTCMLYGAEPHPVWVVPAAACAGHHTFSLATAPLIYFVLESQTPLLCAENGTAQQADNPFSGDDLKNQCPHQVELTAIATNSNAAFTTNTSSPEVTKAIQHFLRAELAAAAPTVVPELPTLMSFSYVKTIDGAVPHNRPSIFRMGFNSDATAKKLCDKLTADRPLVCGCRLELRRYAANYPGDRYQVPMLPGFSPQQMMELLIEQADLDPKLILSFGAHSVEQNGVFTTNGSLEFYVKPVYAVVYHHGNQVTEWAENGDGEQVSMMVPTIPITQPPPAINWSPPDPAESHKVFHRKIRKIGCCRWCWGPNHPEGESCIYTHHCRMCLNNTEHLLKHCCATCQFHVPATERENTPQKRAYDPGMAPGEADPDTPQAVKRKRRQEKKIEMMVADFIALEEGNYEPNKQRKMTGDDSPSRKVTACNLWAFFIFGLADSLKNPLLCTDCCACSKGVTVRAALVPLQPRPNAHSVLYKQRWYGSSLSHSIDPSVHYCYRPYAGDYTLNTKHCSTAAPHPSNGR
jgi:hypothetical protein